MKDRIQKIIKSEKISPSAFAEAIGVQRSSISHILSGRNKPSLDFIQRILSKFDKINPDWLLFGKGKIYKEPSDVFTANITTKPNPEPEKQQPQNDLKYSPTEKPRVEKKPETQQVAHHTEIKTGVEKIVFFYKDGSFKEYIPMSFS